MLTEAQFAPDQPTKLANMPNSAMLPALASRPKRLNSQQNSKREPNQVAAKSKLSMSQRKKANLKSRRRLPFMTLLRVLRKNSLASPTIASLFAIQPPHLSPTSTLFAVPSLEPT